ncbi:hypothetical protein L6452_03925 [Arctium lappa]|uniref:Uncharacterized protein n=1 Tax=Arctium lappa TaxID=4217 RepID=A0ACB9FNP9_ARCLA|nr:hypothetical protein L6452_03925 [Arctium lappa]
MGFDTLCLLVLFLSFLRIFWAMNGVLSYIVAHGCDCSTMPSLFIVCICFKTNMNLFNANANLLLLTCFTEAPLSSRDQEATRVVYLWAEKGFPRKIINHIFGAASSLLH